MFSGNEPFELGIFLQSISGFILRKSNSPSTIFKITMLIVRFKVTETERRYKYMLVEANSQ